MNAKGRYRNMHVYKNNDGNGNANLIQFDVETDGRIIVGIPRLSGVAIYAKSKNRQTSAVPRLDVYSSRRASRRNGTTNQT